MVEKAPSKVIGKEFYLPHRVVLREHAESTKLRVVYDASARTNSGAPSLNDCLHTGTLLQNKLLNILARNPFHMFIKRFSRLKCMKQSETPLDFIGHGTHTPKKQKFYVSLELCLA